MTERRAISGLALSWTQLLLALAGLLVSFGMVYAGLKDHADENTLQIKELKQDSVTRREFDDLKTRLTRIEDKLDAALRKK